MEVNITHQAKGGSMSKDIKKMKIKKKEIITELFMNLQLSISTSLRKLRHVQFSAFKKVRQASLRAA